MGAEVVLSSEQQTTTKTYSSLTPDIIYVRQGSEKWYAHAALAAEHFCSWYVVNNIRLDPFVQTWRSCRSLVGIMWRPQPEQQVNRAFLFHMWHKNRQQGRRECEYSLQERINFETLEFSEKAGSDWVRRGNAKLMSSTQQRIKPSNIYECDLQAQRACKSTPDQLLNEPQENRLAPVVLAVSPLKFSWNAIWREIKLVIVTNLQLSFFLTSLNTSEDTIVPLAWARYMSPAED